VPKFNTQSQLFVYSFSLQPKA